MRRDCPRLLSLLPVIMARWLLDPCCVQRLDVAVIDVVLNAVDHLLDEPALRGDATSVCFVLAALC